MNKKYNPQKFEKKWLEKWFKDKIYQAPDNPSSDEKVYCLDMFPYPSGSGLHVGHVEGYTTTDIYSRYLRMRGKAVLHPMGWDAFGLPAENYAIKTQVHPEITTDQAAQTFKSQMKRLGWSYDWSREIQTSKSDYYRWTQWFFLLLYKNGLAYKKQARVNWCPNCQTVLANEQVVSSGVCERCGTKVIQKNLKQWFFKITDFIEDQTVGSQKTKGLLSGLKDIDWPQSTKLAQENWIGRSEGANVKFAIKGKQSKKESLEVFTTRPDTLFGCTFLVLNPEHRLIDEFADSIENLSTIKNYQEAAKKKNELERTDLAKEKTGIEIKGVRAINPVNRKEMPIFVADYVLANYGSGAIMAVPAHDERDYGFAKKYNLEIIEVVLGGEIEKQAFCEDGLAINSNFLNNLPTPEAKVKMIIWLKKNHLGQKTVNYRLRDWLISRQRYWGAPIPIIYCDHCGEVPVPESDLPVELPRDVDFKPQGQSPLVRSKQFHQVKCPNCQKDARRESDTMDTFVCSSWYFFRFADPKNSQEFASREQIQKWLPVDIYVGGAEHAILHLLYARFMTKVLQKYGYIEFNEPFIKLRHIGLILGEDNSKMSKSRGNIVNPDDIIQTHGADAIRLYEMFMGPLEDPKPWDTKGITGIDRFLDKVWQLQKKVDSDYRDLKLINQLRYQTIKKVTDDIEEFKFNTAIAQLMIFVNGLTREEKISRAIFTDLLKILAPFAPFITEELWQQIGEKYSIHQTSWPAVDESFNQDTKITLAVQVNGKIRGTIQVKAGTLEKTVIAAIQKEPKINKYLTGKIQKTIFVPNKIINLIVF